MANLDKKGTVVGVTAYVDDVLVAEDVTISLPEITPKTQTFNAMGEVEFPLPLIEAMEATVNKVGIDKGFIRLLTPKKRKFEFRWVQTVVKNDGSQEVEGCKAFITGIPKTFFPGGDIAPGENYEGAIPIAVTRFQLYVDGEETTLIDKLKGQIKIDGEDYAKSINNLL
jgi:phage tail tube protein FII